jgi:hypothetical protein
LPEVAAGAGAAVWVEVADGAGVCPEDAFCAAQPLRMISGVNTASADNFINFFLLTSANDSSL